MCVNINIKGALLNLASLYGYIFPDLAVCQRRKERSFSSIIQQVLFVMLLRYDEGLHGSRVFIYLFVCLSRREAVTMTIPLFYLLSDRRKTQQKSTEQRPRLSWGMCVGGEGAGLGLPSVLFDDAISHNR